jgi:hypothetical protein
MTTSELTHSPCERTRTATHSRQDHRHLLDAANAAAEIVTRGKDAWQQHRLMRLAWRSSHQPDRRRGGQAPEQVQAAMPAVPWDDIRANRVLVAHIYHRIDYKILWVTLARGVLGLAAEIKA